MNQLKIAFLGSSYFSADFLGKLITDSDLLRLIEVKMVVTQPDQKAGRKQILTPTPVKLVAEKYKIKYLEIGNWKTGIEAGQEDRKRKIEKNNPSSMNQFPTPFPNLFSIFKKVDLALVYSYGVIIPKEFLVLPKYGFWCIHPSLLPKYRGTSPMATPLINGDKTTGVTIIRMDEKIDHGPIIAQDSYTILNTDYRTDLEKKLTDLGFEMFKKLIKMGVEGLGIPTARSRGILSEASTGGKRQETGPVFMSVEQNHADATYTKKLTKENGFIPFDKLKNAINSQQLTINNQIYNLFRGLHSWPGIWTILPNAKRLKITQLTIDNQQLTITSVQLEGKKEVDFKIFNSVYRIL